MYDMNENEKLLNIAVGAAKRAAKPFKAHFGKPRTVKFKGGDFRDQVTEVDVQIEKLISSYIKTQLPTSQFIGEEITPGQRDNLGKIFWIIDPIDGTSNYIQGIPLCCISIAAWNSRGPLAAVLYNAVSGEMFTAAKGKGAFLNGKKIHVSNTKSVSRALGGVGWFKPKDGLKLFGLLIIAGRKLRVLATTAWQLGLVAAGKFDFYATTDVHIWDVAAGMLIVSEAGGEFSTIKGGPINLDCLNILASNKKIHKELLRKIK